MFRLEGCGLATLGGVAMISICAHKNKAETQPTPFSSVIINERIPHAPLAKAFQGLIGPAIEEDRTRES